MYVHSFSTMFLFTHGPLEVSLSGLGCVFHPPWSYYHVEVLTLCFCRVAAVTQRMCTYCRLWPHCVYYSRLKYSWIFRTLLEVLLSCNFHRSSQLCCRLADFRLQFVHWWQWSSCADKVVDRLHSLAVQIHSDSRSGTSAAPWLSQLVTTVTAPGVHSVYLKAVWRGSQFLFFLDLYIALGSQKEPAGSGFRPFLNKTIFK